MSLTEESSKSHLSGVRGERQGPAAPDMFHLPARRRRRRRTAAIVLRNASSRRSAKECCADKFTVSSARRMDAEAGAKQDRWGALL
jgi:hypothetical protein